MHACKFNSQDLLQRKQSKTNYEADALTASDRSDLSDLSLQRFENINTSDVSLLMHLVIYSSCIFWVKRKINGM
jgi:hypothetical protein